MGSALVKGAINKGAIKADSVSVFDVIDSASKKLANDIGATIASSHDDLINNYNVGIVTVVLRKKIYQSLEKKFDNFNVLYPLIFCWFF